jgi:hypothetical protein
MTNTVLKCLSGAALLSLLAAAPAFAEGGCESHTAEAVSAEVAQTAIAAPSTVQLAQSSVPQSQPAAATAKSDTIAVPTQKADAVAVAEKTEVEAGQILSSAPQDEEISGSVFDSGANGY